MVSKKELTSPSGCSSRWAQHIHTVSPHIATPGSLAPRSLVPPPTPRRSLNLLHYTPCHKVIRTNGGNLSLPQCKETRRENSRLWHFSVTLMGTARSKGMIPELSILTCQPAKKSERGGNKLLRKSRTVAMA